MMVFENNFVETSASKSDILDPELKLRLATGRWNPESTAKAGNFDIVLFHDPDIRADRLTMPPSEKIVRNRQMLGAPPLDEIVFVSDRSQEIAQISLAADQKDDEVALIYRGGREPTLIYTARLIEMADRGSVSEHPWQTLRYMLESIPLMPIWREDYAAAWGSHRISFYLARPMADELTKFAGLPPIEGDGELVRISTLEVGS